MAMPVALVVDKDIAACRCVSSALRQAGATAILAHTAADAVNSLQSNTPQFLFTGLRLPDRHGISLIADARQISPRIVVVVVSGDTTPESVVQAMRLGVCDYVFKPATTSKILTAFERARTEAQKSACPPVGVALSDAETTSEKQIANTTGAQTVTVPLVGDLKAIERQLLKEVIWRCDGNKAAAARTLGMHRRTLYRMLAENEE